MFKGLEWRTNKISFIEEDEKRILVKEFDVLKPALIFTLYNIACFVDSLLHLSIFKFEDYYFPSIKERIENEVKGREILSQICVKTPKIYYYDEKKICMEFIEGMNLLDFYGKASLNEIYEVSRGIGLKVKKLHECGYTYVDCRVENYIVRSGEICRVDLEFFSKISKFREISDIVTYDTSILGLEEERCITAIRAFHEGYGRKPTNTELAYITLFSSIYPLSLKEGLSNIINRTSNTYTLLKENLKDMKLLEKLKSLILKREGKYEEG